MGNKINTVKECQLLPAVTAGSRESPSYLIIVLFIDNQIMPSPKKQLACMCIYIYHCKYYLIFAQGFSELSIKLDRLFRLGKNFKDDPFQPFDLY